MKKAFQLTRSNSTISHTTIDFPVNDLTQRVPESVLFEECEKRYNEMIQGYSVRNSYRYEKNSKPVLSAVDELSLSKDEKKDKLKKLAVEIEGKLNGYKEKLNNAKSIYRSFLKEENMFGQYFILKGLHDYTYSNYIFADSDRGFPDFFGTFSPLKTNVNNHIKKYGPTAGAFLLLAMIYKHENKDSLYNRISMCLFLSVLLAKEGNNALISEIKNYAARVYLGKRVRIYHDALLEDELPEYPFKKDLEDIIDTEFFTLIKEHVPKKYQPSIVALVKSAVDAYNQKIDEKEALKTQPIQVPAPALTMDSSDSSNTTTSSTHSPSSTTSSESNYVANDNCFFSEKTDTHDNSERSQLAQEIQDLKDEITQKQTLLNEKERIFNQKFGKMNFANN